MQRICAVLVVVCKGCYTVKGFLNFNQSLSASHIVISDDVEFGETNITTLKMRNVRRAGWLFSTNCVEFMVDRLPKLTVIQANFVPIYALRTFS